MGLSRRRFLGFAAGAAAGTALGMPSGGAFSSLVASLESSLHPPRGPEDLTLSICALCPGGCGLRVRRVGGRPVKLEGNPLHPVNGGRLCPKGQAALQSLYHPDRLPGPMRRVGPRGSLGSFEPTTWGAALDEIGARLVRLREEGRPESLALVRGHSRGLAARLASRFLEAFGSPNDVLLHRGEEAACLALYRGLGVRTTPAFDLQAADYVLSFGGALLEAWGSPVYMMRSYGEFRQGRPGRRGKLVQVGPRLSVTASAADEWIAVPPGTEGLLALGIAGVLVAENLYDATFINERTLGLEQVCDREGARRIGLREVLERYASPERVSAETGVSVDVIFRIAREFAGSRHPMAVGPCQGPLLPGRLFDHLAPQLLNVLAGNLDGPGGLLVPEEVPLSPWPDPPLDRVARKGRGQPRVDAAGGESFPLLRSDPEGLAHAILEGSPYRVDVLMILGADPVFTCADPQRFAAALERVPLVVSFASLPDETALLSDWILPQAHFLETWELDTTPPGIAFPMVSLGQPALEAPLHDARPAAEIVLDLGRRVFGEKASPFPWRDLPALIRSEVEGLYEARRGAAMGTPFDEAWVRLMERAGWWAPGYRSAQELWQLMQERGGWWDPFYDHGNWKRIIKTSSGRYEFRPELLGAFPSRAEVSERSLALLLFEPLPISGGVGAELPFLEGLLDPGLAEGWGTWVEIHPRTAAALGVADKDWVRVESPHGAIVVKARVTARVVSGAAAIPVGLGRKGGGRWARGRGANPLRLLSPDRDPLSGLPDFGATRVKLSVVGRPREPRPAMGRG